MKKKIYAQTTRSIVRELRKLGPFGLTAGKGYTRLS